MEPSSPCTTALAFVFWDGFRSRSGSVRRGRKSSADEQEEQRVYITLGSTCEESYSGAGTAKRRVLGAGKLAGSIVMQWLVSDIQNCSPGCSSSYIRLILSQVSFLTKACFLALSPPASVWCPAPGSSRVTGQLEMELTTLFSSCAFRPSVTLGWLCRAQCILQV